MFFFLNVQLRYDRRVRVTFQENAWCNERVMKEWVLQQWKPACDGEMLLVLDDHKAQRTDDIRSFLEVQGNTKQIVVPAGTI